MYSVDFSFLPTYQKTPIFLAHYSPIHRNTSPGSENRTVILIPPFAEELNRSKRMYVLCARLLASKGINVLCFDYVGTGDSYGEWGSIRLEDWYSNLADVYQFIRQSHTTKISFIGLRFGALLAADIIASKNLEIDKCIFWDPVENGEVFIRQQFRIKIAAAMAEEGKKLDTKTIHSQLMKQEYIEIGGYQISAGLIDDINKLNLAISIESVIKSTELHWMTLNPKQTNNSVTLYPAIIPEHLNQKVKMHLVTDSRFWMQQEVTISSKLLQATKNIFTGEV